MTEPWRSGEISKHTDCPITPPNVVMEQWFHLGKKQDSIAIIQSTEGSLLWVVRDCCGHRKPQVQVLAIADVVHDGVGTKRTKVTVTYKTKHTSLTLAHRWPNSIAPKKNRENRQIRKGLCSKTLVCEWSWDNLNHCVCVSASLLEETEGRTQEVFYPSPSRKF